MKKNTHENSTLGTAALKVCSFWPFGKGLDQIKRWVLRAVPVLGLVILNSCGGGGQQGGDSLDGRIRIDGSSTVYPITEAIAEEYRSEQPDVRVTVGVSGSGGGFKKFTRGETDISNASRPIMEQEIAQAKENGVEYIELTIAYDGIAVLVNPDNDWVDHFTVEELEKLWEPEAQGKITRWNQIRPEWPDEKINLYGPGVASGTYDYFTEAIVGQSGSSRGDFTASEDDNVLVQGVAGDKYGVGFFGLAYYEENAQKLKLVGVDNGDGKPVKPTIETVASNTYKPLSRPVFIYVRKEAAKKKTVEDFVRYYLNQAGNLVKDVGYVPLPEEEYKEELAKFKKFIGESSNSS